MKTIARLTAMLALGLLFFSHSAQAQRFSATANFSSFNVDRVQDANTEIDYRGSSSLSANLRFYTQKKWAFRAGVGVDNLRYTVDGADIETNYSARRQDIRGIFGIEKHWMIADRVDIYPGAFIPIVITGDDIIDQNLASVSNGDLRAGLGLLLGANVKLLKILRVGVEFDATFDSFSSTVRESAETTSLVPFRGLNYNTAFTLGLAF